MKADTVTNRERERADESKTEEHQRLRLRAVDWS
jgi:hypothetical protein